MGLFVVTSALCAIVPSIHAMIALRFIEAVGACAGMVIARAMVRDLFKPEEGARVFSTLMLVMVLAPVLAPLIGSYLLIWFGWKSIFWALALAGMASLLSIAFRLPESHPADPERSLAFGYVMKVYGQLIARRRYVMTVLAGAFAFGGLFSYITGSSFVFIEFFHLSSEHYGWLFAINSAGIMAASQTNRRLMHRLGAVKLLRIGGGIQSAAGVIMLAAAATGWGGIVGFSIPLFVYVACIGVISPNATALAMADEQRHAGAASALMGAIQFAIGTLTALATGALHAVTPLPVAAVIAVCGVMTSIMLVLAVGRATVPAR